MSAPTSEEHLQETLKTLNTAVTLIEEMKRDIVILRTGMTEIRREAEELQRRRSVSVQYIIDRVNHALEGTPQGINGCCRRAGLVVACKCRQGAYATPRNKDIER